MNSAFGHTPVAVAPVEAGGYIATVEELRGLRRSVAESGDPQQWKEWNDTVVAHKRAREEQMNSAPAVPQYTSSYASQSVANAYEDVPAGSYPQDYDDLIINAADIQIVGQRKGARKPAERDLAEARALPTDGPETMRGGPLPPVGELPGVGIDVGLAKGQTLPIVGVDQNGNIGANLTMPMLQRLGEPVNLSPDETMDQFAKDTIDQMKRSGGDDPLTELMSAGATAANEAMAQGRPVGIGGRGQISMDAMRDRPVAQPDNSAPALAPKPAGTWTEAFGQIMYNLAKAFNPFDDVNQSPDEAVETERAAVDMAIRSGNFGTAITSYLRLAGAKMRKAGADQGTNVDVRRADIRQTGGGKTVKITQKSIEDYRAVVHRGIRDGWLDLDGDTFKAIPDDVLGEVLEQQQVMLGSYDRDTYVRNRETLLQMALLLVPEAAGARAIHAGLSAPALAVRAQSAGRLAAMRIGIESGWSAGLAGASARPGERGMTAAFAGGASLAMLGSAASWRYIGYSADPGAAGSRFVRGFTDDLINKHGLDPMLATGVAENLRGWADQGFVAMGDGNLRAAANAYAPIDEMIDASLLELSQRMGLLKGSRDFNLLRQALTQQKVFEKEMKNARVRAMRPASVANRVEAGLVEMRAGLTTGDIKTMWKGIKTLGSTAKLRNLNKYIDQLAKDQPVLRARLEAVASYLSKTEGEVDSYAAQIAAIKAKLPTDVAAQTKLLRAKEKALREAHLALQDRMIKERRLVRARIDVINGAMDKLLEGLDPETAKWIKNDPLVTLNSVRATMNKELEYDLPEVVRSAARQLAETRTIARDLNGRAARLEAQLGRRMDNIETAVQAIRDRGQKQIDEAIETFNTVREQGVEGLVDAEINRITAAAVTRGRSKVTDLNKKLAKAKTDDDKLAIMFEIDAAKAHTQELVEKTASKENRQAVALRLSSDGADNIAVSKAGANVQKVRDAVEERVRLHREKYHKWSDEAWVELDDLQNRSAAAARLDARLTEEINGYGQPVDDMVARAARISDTYQRRIDTLIERVKNRGAAPKGAEDALKEFRRLADEKTELAAAQAAAENVSAAAINSAKADFITTMEAAGGDLASMQRQARKAMDSIGVHAGKRAFNSLDTALKGVLPDGAIGDVFSGRMTGPIGDELVGDIDDDVVKANMMKALQQINNELGSVVVGRDRSMGMPMPNRTKLRLPRVVKTWAEQLAGAPAGSYKTSADIPLSVANELVSRYRNGAQSAVQDYYRRQRASAMRSAVAGLARAGRESKVADIKTLLAEAETAYGLPPGALSRNEEIRVMVQKFKESITRFENQPDPRSRIKFLQENPEDANILAAHVTDLYSEGYLARLGIESGIGELTADTRIPITVKAIIAGQEWTHHGAGGKQAKMFDIPQKIANAVRRKMYGSNYGPWMLNNFVLLNDAFGELGLDMNRVITEAHIAAKLEAAASKRMEEPMRQTLERIQDLVQMSKERGAFPHKSFKEDTEDMVKELNEMITEFRDASAGSKDAQMGLDEVTDVLRTKFKLEPEEVRIATETIDHLYDEFYNMAADAHPGIRRVGMYTPRQRKTTRKAPPIRKRNISKPRDPFYSFERLRTAADYENERNAGKLARGWYDSYMRRFAGKGLWEAARDMHEVSALLLRKGDAPHPLVSAMKNVAEYAERKRPPLPDGMFRTLTQISSFRHALMLTGVRTAFRNAIDPIVVTNLNDFASTRNNFNLGESLIALRAQLRHGDYAKDGRVYKILDKYHATGDHLRIYSRSSMIMNEVEYGYGGGKLTRWSDNVVDVGMGMMRFVDLSGRIGAYTAGESASQTALKEALETAAKKGGSTNEVFKAFQQRFGVGRLSAGEWNDVWVKIDKGLKGGTYTDLHEFVGVRNSLNTMFDYTPAGVSKLQAQPWTQAFIPFYSYLGSRSALAVRAMARGDMKSTISAMLFEVAGVVGATASNPLLREMSILGSFSSYLGYMRSPDQRANDQDFAYGVIDFAFSPGMGDVLATSYTAIQLLVRMAALPASDLKLFEDYVTRNDYESGADDGVPGTGKERAIRNLAFYSEQMTREGQQIVTSIGLLKNAIAAADVAFDQRSTAELGVAKRLYSVYSGSRPQESTIDKQIAKEKRRVVEQGSGIGADTLGTINSLDNFVRITEDVGNGMRVLTYVDARLNTSVPDYVWQHMNRAIVPKGQGPWSAVVEGVANPHNSSAPIHERVIDKVAKWDRERRYNWNQ